MDSDDDVIIINSDDEDSGNVSSNNVSSDDDSIGIAISDNKPTSSNEVCGASKSAMDSDEYQFEIMSAEQVVQYMIDSIMEVNTVVQLPITITRILLNYFNWDKEKLYEA